MPEDKMMTSRKPDESEKIMEIDRTIESKETIEPKEPITIEERQGRVVGFQSQGNLKILNMS